MRPGPKNLSLRYNAHNATFTTMKKLADDIPLINKNTSPHIGPRPLISPHLLVRLAGGPTTRSVRMFLTTVTMLRHRRASLLTIRIYHKELYPRIHYDRLNAKSQLTEYAGYIADVKHIFNPFSRNNFSLFAYLLSFF